MTFDLDCKIARKISPSSVSSSLGGTYSVAILCVGQKSMYPRIDALYIFAVKKISRM